MSGQTRECTYQGHPAWIVGAVDDDKLRIGVRRSKEERGTGKGPSYDITVSIGEVVQNG